MKPQLKRGYGYIASSVNGWRSSESDDDEWDIVPISSDAKEWTYNKPKFVGYRMIDGVRCAVFETRPGDYYAQTAVYTGVGKRRAGGSLAAQIDYPEPTRRPGWGSLVAMVVGGVVVVWYWRHSA